MIIYIDVLIITNFIINYFLLKITQIFSSSFYDKKRLIISSFIGALFSLIVLIDINSFLLSILIKILAVIISILIAFGFVNYYYFFKNVLSMLLANFMLYGFLAFIEDNSVIILKDTIIYLNINPVILVLSVLFIWIVITIFNIFFNEKLSSEDIKIKLVLEKGEVVLSAFYDTGFKLKDIINNYNVILVEIKKIENLVSEKDIKDIENFFDNINIENTNFITPIFYSTINGEGMLPSIKAKNIYIIQKDIKKEIKNCRIALAKEKISNEKEAIIGKEVAEVLLK